MARIDGNKKRDSIAPEDAMPHKVNPEKSDLSVSIGARLRKALVEACEEDEVSLTHATKEALKRWLATRERKRQRAGEAQKMRDS